MPAKRYILKSSTSSASSSRPSKKQKFIEVGAPGEHDVKKPPREDLISSSSASTRSLKPPVIPSLGYIAAKVFARHFPTLYSTESGVVRTKPLLQALPDSVASKLFEALRASCPGVLTPAMISAVRRRSNGISLLPTMSETASVVLPSSTEPLAGKRVDSGEQAHYTGDRKTWWRGAQETRSQRLY
jgi:hypothetical protein